MRRQEPTSDDWYVSLNGIKVPACMVAAADSIEGWIDIFELNSRYEGGRVLVHKGVFFHRRLHGDVLIKYRGIPLSYASA